MALHSALQTGGMLFEAGSPLDASFARIAADMGARYFVKFDSSGHEDGAFHNVQVRAKRKGTVVRAPSGYWAPFAASRLRFTIAGPHVPADTAGEWVDSARGFGCHRRRPAARE